LPDLGNKRQWQRMSFTDPNFEDIRLAESSRQWVGGKLEHAWAVLGGSEPTRDDVAAVSMTSFH